MTRMISTENCTRIVIDFGGAWETDEASLPLLTVFARRCSRTEQWLEVWADLSYISAICVCMCLGEGWGGISLRKRKNVLPWLILLITIPLSVIRKLPLVKSITYIGYFQWAQEIKYLFAAYYRIPVLITTSIQVLRNKFSLVLESTMFGQESTVVLSMLVF